MSPSSIRLGRRPLTSLRGVQIPLVTPVNARRPHRNDVAFFASRHTAKGPRRTGGCIYGITRRLEQMSFERGEDSGKRNFSEKNFSLSNPARLAPIPPIPETFILPNPRSAVFSGTNYLWKRLVATWNGSNANKKGPATFRMQGLYYERRLIAGVGSHFAVRGKKIANIIFGSGPGEIADIKRLSHKKRDLV